MAITDTDIADLVTTTLRDLGRNKFQQIAQSLQDYEMMGKWLTKEKIVFDSGIGIQKTLMLKTGGAAQHVGLFEEDEVNIVDLLTQLQVPWRRATTNWAFERRELLENKGKALIVNIMKPRRAAAMIDLAETLEASCWGTAPTAADKKEPWGVQTWIVKNSSEGFNGGLPSDHTTMANVNISTYPNFKNYTNSYTSVTKADLIKKLRKAHRKIKFKSPVTIQDFRGSGGDRYRLYVNESTISDIEDLGEAQNENLGRDIASMDGQMVFRRHPILWVPQLDAQTDNPVYMLDHSCFHVVVLSGDYLRESGVQQAPKQHNVFQTFVDLSYNFCCVDRRRNAVLHVA